ncbi:MAG TPA: Gfo/Idh/MocA family oxidoreductase [Cyclobacteriaceae bacterium]|jgi:predicted dehydrogenase|nr:Gfo/Idh/MocA family oxidoreductase [Cyclobacteriaceae bacterium]
MREVKWAILGCGKIARKFASDLQYVKNAKLIAVAARDQATAEKFAQEFPVKHIHGSYQSLVENSDVDVIYVATPHGLHHEHVMLCLKHKKAVLCEKAFALNSRQAKEMISFAKAQNVFLMEALWSKFLPHYQKLMEIVQSKKLGDLKSVLINFGFVPQEPVAPRLLDPALGGGSLLDIGIYNVFFALSILGKPDEVEASMTPSSTPVDEQCAILFKYKTGALAQLFCTFSSNLATEADIGGERGRIRLSTRFYEPSAHIEYYPGNVSTKQIIDVKKEAGFGYHYEAQHVTECLIQGLKESPVMKFSDTLELMETLDCIRAKANIRYPADL